MSKILSAATKISRNYYIPYALMSFFANKVVERCLRDGTTIDIRHRMGLETDHVCHIASPDIRVCDNEVRSRLLPRFYFELSSLLE